MTREARTLLVIGMLAVGAVVALGVMASRYSKMQPLKSVEDLEPAAEEVIDRTAGEATEPVEATANVAAEPLDPVDAFIVVRKAVIEAIDADPGMKRRMAQELSGEARQTPSRLHYKILLDAKFAREETCERLGITVDEYHRVRESFIAWMGDEFAEKAAEPELVARFESRRAELEPLYLDLFETVDQGR